MPARPGLDLLHGRRHLRGVVTRAVGAAAALPPRVACPSPNPSPSPSPNPGPSSSPNPSHSPRPRPRPRPRPKPRLLPALSRCVYCVPRAQRPQAATGAGVSMEAAQRGQGGELRCQRAPRVRPHGHETNHNVGRDRLFDMRRDRLQRHMQPTGGHVRADELDDGGGHGGSEPDRRTSAGSSVVERAECCRVELYK